MRLTELIGCEVYDRHGRQLGAVHDLRFVVTSSAENEGPLDYRLDALVVGDVAVGHRFGFVTGREMAGPWWLAKLSRALARRSHVVPWNDVARFERPRIDVVGDADDYRATTDREGEGP